MASLSFGSNHVVMGGMMPPASAMAIKSLWCLRDMENAGVLLLALFAIWSFVRLVTLEPDCSPRRSQDEATGRIPAWRAAHRPPQLPPAAATIRPINSAKKDQVAAQARLWDA